MSATMTKQVCLQCAKPVSGNENKKFCSDGCKNAFHNQRRKQESIEIGEIITALKVNRRVLAELLGDRSTQKVSAQRLIDQGFIFITTPTTGSTRGTRRNISFVLTRAPSTTFGWYMIVRGFKEGE